MRSDSTAAQSEPWGWGWILSSEQRQNCQFQHDPGPGRAADRGGVQHGRVCSVAALSLLHPLYSPSFVLSVARGNLQLGRDRDAEGAVPQAGTPDSSVGPRLTPAAHQLTMQQTPGF